ncbi:MAG: NUDIX hydrolase [Bacilli bacterium]
MRHFCASVFVINPANKKILLVHHKTFNRWVQPGGHIEENETPEETALREVYEETGLKVQLIGQRFPREDDFIRPLGIQKNRGKQGDVHIDIIYAAIPINEIDINNKDDEIDKAKWFSRNELDKIDVFEDIKITMDYLLTKFIRVVK